jgi:dTDP-4-amino-4,6-dideoxygalactose transaminase
VARNGFLQFQPPCLDEREADAVIKALASGWITTGPLCREFETTFAARFGSIAALSVSSCTAAMHTALATLGVGSGDEVITTPMTFAATVNVIEHVGATPILADVEPDTLNIAPSEIARRVTSRTKAIMPVHYAGHPADLDAIGEIASSHHLTMVEDAAHAVAAKYKGRWIGYGDSPVAFSFYATKNLTTGEGGMLTGSPEFLERARAMSLHGMSHDAWNRYSKDGSWYYEVVAPGFKYNMSDIMAAIGLVQLGKLDSMQERRRATARRYTDAFGDCDAVECPTERPEVLHAWHLYVLRLNLKALRIDRAQFIEQLTTRNIGASVHFIPIHLHPYYREKYGYRPSDYPVAYENYQRIISLPMSAKHTDQDVDDVIEAVLDIVKEYKR